MMLAAVRPPIGNQSVIWNLKCKAKDGYNKCVSAKHKPFDKSQVSFGGFILHVQIHVQLA